MRVLSLEETTFVVGGNGEMQLVDDGTGDPNAGGGSFELGLSELSLTAEEWDEVIMYGQGRTAPAGGGGTTPRPSGWDRFVTGVRRFLGASAEMQITFDSLEYYETNDGRGNITRGVRGGVRVTGSGGGGR